MIGTPEAFTLLNQWADQWWLATWAGFWQFAVLVALALVVDRGLRARGWPQIRLMLWSLVMLKLMAPFWLYAPTGLLSGWFGSTATPLLVEGVAHTLDQSLPGDVFEPAVAVLSGATGLSRDPAPFVWALPALLVWSGGVLLLGAAYCWRCRSLQGALIASAEYHRTPDWVNALAQTVAQEAGLRRAPRVLLTDSLHGPAVFGLLRPTVVLPHDAPELANRRRLRHVLLHELAHVRRGDLWVQALVVAILLLNWFNPLAYFVSRRIQELRELACDATVSRWLREETASYRDTLLQAAGRLPSQRRLSAPVLALFDDPATIVARLRSLERMHWRGAGWRRPITLGLTGGMLVFVMPMGAEPHRLCAPGGGQAGEHHACDEDGDSADPTGNSAMR